MRHRRALTLLRNASAVLPEDHRVMPTAAGTLHVVHAQGAQRYALHDRVLSGGDIVQLCCSGGWVTGRFEHDAGAPPRFHFSIELDGGRFAPFSFDIPERALLRRP
jgi:hypothetical protein